MTRSRMAADDFALVADAGNFVEFDLRNFNVKIDAIKQRAGNASKVFLNFARGTARFGRHFAVGRARCCLFATAP